MGVAGGLLVHCDKWMLNLILNYHKNNIVQIAVAEAIVQLSLIRNDHTSARSCMVSNQSIHIELSKRTVTSSRVLNLVVHYLS